MENKPKTAGALEIHGIGVSPGICVGRVRLLKKPQATLTGILLDTEEAALLEIEKFDQAVRISVAEVEALIASADETWSEEGIEILETQIEFLSDPQIRTDVSASILTDRKNVNDALLEVIGRVVRMFLDMTDAYMQARSADIRDIGNRILKNLDQPGQEEITTFEPGTIIIAEDISPSDTITMDIKNVIGFATQAGGATSHAAIVAKARGIPAVVGCGDGLTVLENNDTVILDGLAGVIIQNPDAEILARYQARQENYSRHLVLLRSLQGIAATTIDGTEIKLLANISEAADMDQVFENGGDGVGLLRSELLFMGRNSFPNEDEQFEFYKKVALKSQDKPVIIRTIDIGGDKQLPYFNLPRELNPFLGYRAIRICLDRKDLFLVQLKAILRAGVFGNLKIMFPMISNVQEIREAKLVLELAKQELLTAGIGYKEHMEIGIMIEIPSAAVTADILAKEVDFFSIGTNDLCQYTLAVDRMNEKVAALYDPFNPGVLRLISNVIEQGHKMNIHVGMCGEMAGDPMATLLLLGMGLREFSMSAVSIPAVKHKLVNSSFLEAGRVCQRVMEMDSSDDIKSYLSGLLRG